MFEYFIPLSSSRLITTIKFKLKTLNNKYLKMSKLIFALCFLLKLVVANLPNQAFTAAWLDGRWSSELIGNQFSIGKPAQYFVCGIQFLSMKWSKWIDCKCRKRIYAWRWRYTCFRCQHHSNTKTCGIKITYCSYTNWHEQITKEVLTNSPGCTNWRQPIKCGPNYYASAIAASTHIEHDAQLGLIGLKLRCSTSNYQYHSQISDSSHNSYTDLYTPKAGKFISGMFIKYISHQNLVGVTANFEAMAKITAISINYNTDTKYESFSTNIQRQTVSNCKNQAVTQKVTVNKTYETYSKWEINDKYALNAKISKDITVPAPNLSKKQFNNRLYKSSSDPFSFQINVKNKLETAQQLNILVHSKTKSIVNTDVNELRGSFSFHAVLTFCQQVSGNYIMKHFVEGEWSGIAMSQINNYVSQDKQQCSPGQS